MVCVTMQVLPDSLTDALQQASETTRLAIADGVALCIVSLTPCLSCAQTLHIVWPTSWFIEHRTFCEMQNISPCVDYNITC